MIAFKAHFDGKVIVPDEPLKLPTNQSLLIHVELAQTTNSEKSSPSSVMDWLVENAVEDDLPPDLSYQHDHYLYGTPKKEEPKI
jgi:hypothetical protein